MSDIPSDDATSSFDPVRGKLAATAYRMLGSLADAEDVVQDAFLRWLATDRGAVDNPAAYLHRTVTRLCLDELKSGRRKREIYPGTWLPEPTVEDDEEGSDDVTLPLMLALERLSPLQRAVFVLHDLFDVPFEEVAVMIDRRPGTCRQLARRARIELRAERRRFAVSRERGEAIAAAFYEATRSGDAGRLSSLLADDVVLYTDGGGKVTAVSRPIHGANAVVRLFMALARHFAAAGSRPVQFCTVGGLSGFVTIEDEKVLQTTALDLCGDRIEAIYVTRNPEKLRHLEERLRH